MTPFGHEIEFKLITTYTFRNKQLHSAKLLKNIYRQI